MVLTISRLADQVGVSADTLRYYERLGLVPAPIRNRAGYRIYDDAAGERLRFIKTAQHMGLRLTDIKDLLDIKDRGGCPCGHTTAVVERRLSEVDAELARLRMMRNELVALRARNRDCADVSGDTWWTCTTRRPEGGDEQ